jgi:hypothetical protein
VASQDVVFARGAALEKREAVVQHFDASLRLRV